MRCLLRLFSCDVIRFVFCNQAELLDTAALSQILFGRRKGLLILRVGSRSLDSFLGTIGHSVTLVVEVIKCFQRTHRGL